MTDLTAADGHATPLTPAERDGLVPTHVTLRSELNELEQQNIAEADLWAFRRKRNVLDEGFLKRLHGRMFANVWRWAGEYRETERNLGVAPHLIAPDMRRLLSDADYWRKHKTDPPDELAVRLHHRLVSIHPFANGNGRWSRLAADLLIVRHGGARFTWGSMTWGSATWGRTSGSTNLHAAGDVRQKYIEALKATDRHDLAPLIAFARS